MKLTIKLIVTFLACIAAVGYLAEKFGVGITYAQEVIKMPEVIILGKDAKLGQVTFNHVSHNNGRYGISGTGPIACVECHHTAQPTSALEKRPPLRTSWPKDRKTTLTAELFAKDPNGAGATACRDCHARAGMTPKLLPTIPQIMHEGSTAMIELTNQQAFHRSCTGCHGEIKKTNLASKGPTATQCTMCHKKAAA
jgi:cytochrome c553